MKISKYNETVIADKYDAICPIKCKFKYRVPDPGICWVIEINFEDKRITWSNGIVRGTAEFDNVIFIPDFNLLNSVHKYNV